MFKPDIPRIRTVLNLQKRGDGKLCGKIWNGIEPGSPSNDAVSAINRGKLTDYPRLCHFCTFDFSIKGIYTYTRNCRVPQETV